MMLMMMKHIAICDGKIKLLAGIRQSSNKLFCNFSGKYYDKTQPVAAARVF